MQIDRLWLRDFRSYTVADVELSPGLTAVVGRNGQGKTNLLEAISFLATLTSFRGAPTDALIRDGAGRAVIRAEGSREGRRLLIESELVRAGRTRTQVNRQPLQRSRDLLGAVRVTVFSPDDLVLVKGGPSERRRFLDDGLVACRPTLDRLRGEVDRVLRQRNALLKQSGGRATSEIEATLDVWDAKLAESGEHLAAARAAFVEQLGPHVDAALRGLAQSAEVRLTYEAPWREQGLLAALAATRRDDLRRGITQIGPHRDDLTVVLSGRLARTHASQGEQRSLALALRLGVHELVAAEVGSRPVLLLDDVFSELDPVRSRALVELLPTGQAVLTTASELPAGSDPDQVLTIAEGTVLPRSGT